MEVADVYLMTTLKLTCNFAGQVLIKTCNNTLFPSWRGQAWDCGI